MKKSSTLEKLRLFNRELVEDLFCSPNEYLSRIGARIRLPENLNEQAVLAEIEIALGVKYAEYGQPHPAFKHFAKAEAIYASIPQEKWDPWWLALMYSRYGIAYDDVLDFEQALFHHVRALDIHRRLADEAYIVRDLLNIGYIYLQMGAGDDAISYLKQASLQPDKYSHIATSAYAYLGNAYELLHEYEQAKEYYYRAFNISPNFMKQIAFLSMAAYCCIALNEIDEAERLLDTAQSLQMEQENPFYVRLYLALSQTKLAIVRGQYALAWSACERVLAEAVAIGDVQAQGDILLEQAHTLFAQGRYEACRVQLSALLEMNLAFRRRLSANQLLLDVYAATEQWQQAYELQQGINKLKLFTQSRLRVMQQLIDSRRHEIALEEKNEELAASNHEKDELLRIVAHDLRNPLTAAMTTLGVLIMYPDRFPPDELQRRQTQVADSLYAMEDIILQLTSLSEVDSEASPIHFEAVEIWELVDSVISENIVSANQKQQQLIAGELTRTNVYGNHSWLKQILSNLVSNAIKYSPEGATTTISGAIAPGGKSFRLTVEDEGLGLSPQDLDSMFVKYHKLSAKPTGNETSTGLGLYIVKALLDKMEGSVTAESDGKGLGSIFSVILPLAEV
ncbi:MAG: hypothetical protein H6642_04555 [Caldilineaceae bacterium]|nr:hypothetical protein [Caldilineaceae bacterium]